MYKKSSIFKTILIFVIINILLFIPDVYAGRGCCSHNGGVDETKCTTDGRQVCNKDEKISNGDSCKCDPNNYAEENLIDPEGHDETNPYSHESNGDSNSSNNNVYNYNNNYLDENSNEEDEIVDENVKEGYLALSCTALIGTLIVYLNGLPPRKERDL